MDAIVNTDHQADQAQAASIAADQHGNVAIACRQAVTGEAFNGNDADNDVLQLKGVFAEYVDAISGLGSSPTRP